LATKPNLPLDTVNSRETGKNKPSQLAILRMKELIDKIKDENS